MEKRIKLKFFRLITSFDSCRSKKPSSLPSNPVPSFLRLSPVKLHLPPPPPPPSSSSSSKPCHSFIKRHMSSAFASVSWGFRSRSTATDRTKSPTPQQPQPPPPTQEFHWEEEEKWHVVAKIFDDSNTSRRKIYNPLLTPMTEQSKRRRVKKMMKTTKPRLRISTSSAESGLFSSEALALDEAEEDNMEIEDETETLVSSIRSFSTDYSSPDFAETIRESPFNRNIKRRHYCKKKVRKGKRHRMRKARKSCDQAWSPARLSRFEWLIPCAVGGKVRESFAVVKKSEDPYEDFKKSMMEMIMEKQMFEVEDLEQLLQCFLSLNSRDHHDVIVEAFSQIWEHLFCTTSS